MVRRSALLGLGVDARVDYGEHLIKEFLRSGSDSFERTCSKIDGLHLLAHDETGKSGFGWYTNMKRRPSICVCYRATDSKTGRAIECGYADYQGRSATPLLMTGLRIKCDRHKITLQWDILAHHQTSFPSALPQSYASANAFGALSAIRSSIRCRPLIGSVSVTGMIVILELSSETSTITGAPTLIPIDSTIDLGSLTPWLLPQRCNVVLMRYSISHGYTHSRVFFSPKR